MTKKVSKIWGGAFSLAPSDILEEINASIDFDKNLYAEDIEASIIHATMLARQKIISKTESQKIIKGLKDIKIEIEKGKFQFSRSLEDIHMNIESRLRELIGDTAGKLHTARSRNDQVATDFKLFIRKANEELIDLLKDLTEILLKKSEKYREVLFPGFTHLQNAQIVTLAHHLLAYVEMMLRDIDRLKTSNQRLNQCPLGSAALAGTAFDIDRHFVAKELGFSAPTENSLDAVSDRDFVLDFLYNCSTISLHLTRLAEELVIWLSEPYSFVKLPDNFTTGSSIMPQKRNPDAAELVRGKSGRIFGNLFSLLTVIKALPLAYSKDLQEDKEPAFDSYKNINLCIKAMSEMIDEMDIEEKNILRTAEKGYLTATDLADFLVSEYKMPFRDSHHVSGKIVKLAILKNLQLDDLELDELQAIEPKITKDIYSVLKLETSLKRKTSYGGPAPTEVSKAIKRARKNLSKLCK